MDINKQTLSETKVSGNLLSMKYVPLDLLQKEIDPYFQENPKKHDLLAIAKSIIDSGFIDPPKWDCKLNQGEGGLIYGNGRTKALIVTLVEIKRENKAVPKGVGIAEDGRWCIPIMFGCDSESELAAKRFAIDHNNLTMAGGGFTAIDMAKMWDEEGYLDLLQELADNEELPITLDEDNFDLMKQLIDADDTSYLELQSSEKQGISDDDLDENEESELESGQAIASNVRMAQLFLNTKTHPEFLEMIEILNTKYGTENPTDCTLACLRETVQNYQA